MALLGHPERTFPSIHVAGSNGKGSVCTKMAAAYEWGGKRVGLYTSPHLATFRERIRVNGVMIHEADTVRILSSLFSVVEKFKIPATFFELTTALAFIYFAEQGVDVAILETGLGGRLDATNVVIPLLSVITSISLEHTEILGQTLDEIAYEKGGIIKANIPVVIGPRVPKNIIFPIAEEKKSRCFQVSDNFLFFDEENCAIARKALQILSLSPNSIEQGLTILPPCRFELHDGSPPILFDVAHNPDGLEHLFQATRQKFPQYSLRVVCGLSSNKDIAHCLKIISRHAKRLHLVASCSSRAASLDLLTRTLDQMGLPYEPVCSTIFDTMSSAVKKAQASQEMVVVCGSFFIMAEAREAIGFQDPKDEPAVNEVFLSADSKKYSIFIPKDEPAVNEVFLSADSKKI